MFILDVRKFVVSIPKRNFLSIVPSRNFGSIVIDNFVEVSDPEDAWIRWGQTNIQPFKPGGVDSTKPYGELP